MNLEISAFSRYSTLDYSPDWVGDLLFDGIAQQASRSDTASGIQADGSWRINDRHTLRFGFLAQEETTTADTISEVLPVNSAGVQTSDVPLSIPFSSDASGAL